MLLGMCMVTALGRWLVLWSTIEIGEILLPQCQNHLCRTNLALKLLTCLIDS